MRDYALSQTCLQERIIKYFSDNPKKEICQNCNFCLNLKIKLNEKEKRLFDELKNYNQQYFKTINYQETPAILTIRQMEAIAVLQPQNKADFKKLPGIGSPIIENTEIDAIITRYGNQ